MGSKGITEGEIESRAGEEDIPTFPAELNPGKRTQVGEVGTILAGMLKR